MIGSRSGSPPPPSAKRVEGIAVFGARAYPIGPVMDGYSVQEAASVLGVAEGRVWELLARGVLLGTPEGDSMRVFLKAPARTDRDRRHPRRAAAHERQRRLARPDRRGQRLPGAAHRVSQPDRALRAGAARARGGTRRGRRPPLAGRSARGTPRPPVAAAPGGRAGGVGVRDDPRLGARAVAAPCHRDQAFASRTGPAPPSRSRKARSSRDAVAGFADALARAQDPNRGRPRGGRRARGPVRGERGARQVEARN